MKEDQDIIEKIKKCLRLSRNNPSAEEAETAALMAQRLIAKYHVGVVELQDETDEEESIKKVGVEVGLGKAWKYRLARAVSDNFRCRYFLSGEQTIFFYGYKTDAEVAKEVFTFLFQTGHQLARKMVNAEYYRTHYTKGIYNSFVTGYVAGVKSKLSEQCLALMIVTPPEVNHLYEIMVEGWRHCSKDVRLDEFDSRAYNSGYSEGRFAMDARAIKSAS